MKEHPIIFSSPMVRAILDGTKTQTRRVVKPQPRQTSGGRWHWGYKFGAPKATSPRCVNWCEETTEPGDHPLAEFSPFQVGMMLWVRETWATRYCTARDDGIQGDVPFYRADYEDDPTEVRWRASIHMPRWASRITLEVTEVRVEQVRDISTDDALAEGVDLSRELFPSINAPDKALRLFPRLWDSINGKKYPWEANPWVWVLGFAAID